MQGTARALRHRTDPLYHAPHRRARPRADTAQRGRGGALPALLHPYAVQGRLRPRHGQGTQRRQVRLRRARLHRRADEAPREHDPRPDRDTRPLDRHERRAPAPRPRDPRERDGRADHCAHHRPHLEPPPAPRAAARAPAARRGRDGADRARLHRRLSRRDHNRVDGRRHPRGGIHPLRRHRHRGGERHGGAHREKIHPAGGHGRGAHGEGSPLFRHLGTGEDHRRRERPRRGRPHGTAELARRETPPLYRGKTQPAAGKGTQVPARHPARRRARLRQVPLGQGDLRQLETPALPPRLCDRAGQLRRADRAAAAERAPDGGERRAVHPLDRRDRKGALGRGQLKRRRRLHAHGRAVPLLAAGVPQAGLCRRDGERRLHAPLGAPAARAVRRALLHRPADRRRAPRHPAPLHAKVSGARLRGCIRRHPRRNDRRLYGRGSRVHRPRPRLPRHREPCVQPERREPAQRL